MRERGRDVMRVIERQRVIERVRQGRSGLRMWWPMATRERGRDERCDESEREAESLVRETVRRGFVFCLRVILAKTML